MWNWERYLMHFWVWDGFCLSSLPPATIVNVANLGLLKVALFVQRHKLLSDTEKLIDGSSKWAMRSSEVRKATGNIPPGSQGTLIDENWWGHIFTAGSAFPFLYFGEGHYLGFTVSKENTCQSKLKALEYAVTEHSLLNQNIRFSLSITSSPIMISMGSCNQTNHKP